MSSRYDADFCYAIQKTRGYSVIDTKKKEKRKEEGEKSGEKKLDRAS